MTKLYSQASNSSTDMYEEKIFGGVLHYRTSVGSDWVAFTASELTAKLMEARTVKPAPTPNLYQYYPPLPQFAPSYPDIWPPIVTCEATSKVASSQQVQSTAPWDR